MGVVEVGAGAVVSTVVSIEVSLRSYDNFARMTSMTRTKAAQAALDTTLVERLIPMLAA